MKAHKEQQLSAALWCLQGAAPLMVAEQPVQEKTLRLRGLRAVGPEMTGDDALPGVFVSFVWLDLAELRPHPLSCPWVTKQLSVTAALSSDQNSAQGHLQTPSPSTSQTLFQINHFPDSSPGTGPLIPPPG